MWLTSFCQVVVEPHKSTTLVFALDVNEPGHVFNWTISGRNLSWVFSRSTNTFYNALTSSSRSWSSKNSYRKPSDLYLLRAWISPHFRRCGKCRRSTLQQYTFDVLFCLLLRILRRLHLIARSLRTLRSFHNDEQANWWRKECWMRIVFMWSARCVQKTLPEGAHDVKENEIVVCRCDHSLCKTEKIFSLPCIVCGHWVP